MSISPIGKNSSLEAVQLVKAAAASSNTSSGPDAASAKPNAGHPLDPGAGRGKPAEERYSSKPEATSSASVLDALMMLQSIND